MQITRQTEYAIRTIVELASAARGELLTTKSISQHQEIPEVFLKKTIQLLANAGLITTQRGNQGGVRLAIPAADINIADIVAAVEGKLAINVCLSAAYACPNKLLCRVRDILERAQTALLAELSRDSIADIVSCQTKKG